MWACRMCKLEDCAHACIYTICAQAHTCKRESFVCLCTWMCLCEPAHTNVCSAPPSKWTPRRLYTSGHLLAVKPEIWLYILCAYCEAGQALAFPCELWSPRVFDKHLTATEKSLAHSNYSLSRVKKCALGSAPFLEMETCTPEVGLLP